ncbi:MAG: sulfotransferase, partial [Henriciella sp.]|nr:sulfotransferase [Henriciella sp.]
MQSPMDQSVAVIDRLILAGRESEAVAGLRDLIANAPDLGDGWLAVLNLCDRLGDEDTALVAARFYGKSGVEDLSRQTDYGRRLARVGQMDEALEFMQKVSAHFSNDADAAFEYGTLLAQAGQFEQAETVLRRAIALRPAFGDAWVQLGAFLDFSARPDDVEAMRSAGIKSACAMDFAFGKALDDVGDLAGAMAAWDRANEKQRTIRAPDHRLLNFTDQLSEQFSSLQSGLPTGMTEARAIFILGAPRTGTTLVEQILSAHPDVCGMGETLISRVATWPVRHLSSSDLSQLDAVGPTAWQQ